MIKLILANKDKYIPHLVKVLEAEGADASVLGVQGLVWFLMADEDNSVIGAAYAQAISGVRMFINILLPGDNIHHHERKQLGKDLIEFIQAQASECHKIETLVRSDLKHKIRFYQQLGFKREGVTRKSVVHEGELVDQTYLGLVCEETS